MKPPYSDIKVYNPGIICENAPDCKNYIRDHDSLCDQCLAECEMDKAELEMDDR